jgi:cytochrome P450
LTTGQAAQNFVADAIVSDAEAKAAGTWKEGQKPKYVYDAMLNPDPSKGLKRLTFDGLVDETMLVIAGGGDTSANMIQFSIWQLCQYPDIRKRVLAEINTVPRDDAGRFDCQKLEELPYLVSRPWVCRTRRC